MPRFDALGSAEDRHVIANARECLDPSRVDVVLTHSGCTDGRMAALLIQMCRPDCRIEFLNPGQGFSKAFLDKCGGLNVVMIDIAPASDADFTEMDDAAVDFIVIDHHVSNHAKFFDRGNYFPVNVLSGASAAYLYVDGPHLFEPPNSQLVFDAVQYIQERDTWSWNKGTEEESKKWSLSLNAIICPLGNEEALDVLRKVVLSESEFRRIESDPTGAWKQLRSGVAEIARIAVSVHLPDQKLALLVDLRNRADLNIAINDGGNELSSARGGAVLFARNSRSDPGAVTFSLRGENCIDVAKLFGGGGHRNAAGFTLSSEEATKVFGL